MKKAFVVGVAALACLLAACQDEEVKDNKEDVIAVSAKQASSSYEMYQEQYEQALSEVVSLERALVIYDAEQLKIHYEKRVDIWKAYMNELLRELKDTLPEEEWQELKEQQERWYPQMENVANKAAEMVADEEDLMLVAYYEKKEDAMQVRARYILDEYYFKRQHP